MVFVNRVTTEARAQVNPDENAKKKIRLRYPAVCRGCAVPLVVGQSAWYLRSDKATECLTCSADGVPGGAVARALAAAESAAAAGPSRESLASTDQPRASKGKSPTPVGGGPTPPIETGTAGASARREYQRRSSKRETRIRTAHPKLGGLILALSDEPQSTRPWARGARGEELLAADLDRLGERGPLLLHDRRIRGTRANIDHIAVSDAGVFVIDAKNYVGRPQLRVDGGLLRPRIERLFVGRRDCTSLVTGTIRQADLVRAALAAQPDFSQVPVRAMICFVTADWPLFGGPFRVSGVDVLWPKKATAIITATNGPGADMVSAVHGYLADAFPVA